MQELARLPVEQVVRAQQEDVLAVLASYHGPLAGDLAGEQRHALVARGRAADRLQAEGAEVACEQKLRLDVLAVVGRVGAAVLRTLPHRRSRSSSLTRRRSSRPFRCWSVIGKITVPETGESSKRVITVEPWLSGGRSFDGVVRRSRRAGAATGRSRRPAVTMPSRKAMVEMWPSPTQRSDITTRTEPSSHARLVGMRYDRRVHQRRRGVGILLAEVGADQLLALVAQVVGQVELALHLVEAIHVDRPGLPVAAAEVLVHERELGLAGAHVHRQHRIDDAARTRDPAGGRAATPGGSIMNGRITTRPGSACSRAGRMLTGGKRVSGGRLSCLSPS